MVVIEGTERGEEDANGVASVKKTFAPIITENDMSAIQKKRFNYFKQMRIFLTNICNICERLRYVHLLELALVLIILDIFYYFLRRTDSRIVRCASTSCVAT